MQHEITASAPLLDEKGNLREPGYAKRLLPIYRRADIKAPATRIKEWDYYLVTNDHFAVALTIADNGYMGLDSVSFLQFDEGWQMTRSPMRAFPWVVRVCRSPPPPGTPPAVASAMRWCSAMSPAAGS